MTLHCGSLHLDTIEDIEPILSAAQPLQTLFNVRAAFSSGDDVSGRVSPTLWYSSPPPDDVDVESELVCVQEVFIHKFITLLKTGK